MAKSMSIMAVILMFASSAATAQTANDVPVSQAKLLQKNPREQGEILSEIVRNAHGVAGKTCSSAQASFRKSYEEGSGGWLVHCADGHDHWVLMPAEGGKGAVVLYCPLAKATAGIDCYAAH